MSAIRLRGATSGTTDVVAAAIAGDGVMTLPTGTGTLATAAYVDAAVAAGWKVLQVVSVTKTDTFSTTSSSFIDITDLAVTITPSNVSSRILVLSSINAATQTGTNRAGLRLVRGSTAIGVGAAAGSRTLAAATVFSADGNDIDNQNVTFVDSPATTSATTYKIQIISTGAGTIFCNRSSSDSDSSTQYRTASTITVLEIGA